MGFADCAPDVFTQAASMESNITWLQPQVLIKASGNQKRKRGDDSESEDGPTPKRGRIEDAEPKAGPKVDTTMSGALPAPKDA